MTLLSQDFEDRIRRDSLARINAIQRAICVGLAQDWDEELCLANALAYAIEEHWWNKFDWLLKQLYAVELGSKRSWLSYEYE